jgi:glycosyltransferase involved in cell wall biosynthesis
MTQNSPINSESYWDSRFSDDWQACEGPRQSRFFARLAVENSPSWLIEQIRRQSLIFADWGCAQGDGTDIWASYLNPQQLVGVDFSAVAIEQATERYPAIRFVSENWLEAGVDAFDSYDVVFSSNTLEHFHKPYEVLEALGARAKKAVVLALPYRELERIGEHFYSFLPDNVPLVLSNGFRLVWSRVIDCRHLPNTLWGGDQIFLVYAESSWVDSLKLSLRDIEIGQDDTASEVANLNQEVVARDGQIASLNQEVATRDGQIASLTQLIAERDEQNASLTQLIAERDEQNASLTQSIAERDRKIQSVLSTYSWRMTLPLRLINRLAQAIASQERRYALLKSVYWRLPEQLRHQLNRQRHAYVARRLHHNFALNQGGDHSSVFHAMEQREWLVRANQAERIAIIPCAFEFDELVNQRPINAAKYFAAQGYLVLFVAWQWSPNDTLSKGCGEVWPNVYQVPLFDFVSKAEMLCQPRELSLFLVTMPAPTLVDLIPSLRQRGLAIVYDIMDEWEAFFHVGQAPWFKKPIEDSLVLQSDYVCAVSPSLRDKFAALRLDISVIGNGYTPDVIGVEHKGVAGTQRSDERVIGYFGHLTDAWFDWRQIFHLAKIRTDLTFEIIGYGEPGWVRQESAALPNLRLLGKVLPDDLHRYTSRWSAGIIPFVEGVLAEAVDPIKIYEYLYFGLPVIVTGIRHLKDYPMTYFAERKNVLDTLEHALQSKRKPEEVDAFLERTTWRARFDTLVSELNKNQNMQRLYAN